MTVRVSGRRGVVAPLCARVLARDEGSLEIRVGAVDPGVDDGDDDAVAACGVPRRRGAHRLQRPLLALERVTERLDRLVDADRHHAGPGLGFGDGVDGCVVTVGGHRVDVQTPVVGRDDHDLGALPAADPLGEEFGGLVDGLVRDRPGGGADRVG